MQETFGYGYKEMGEKLGLNHIPETAIIVAFDTIVSEWFNDISNNYSTYLEQNTNILFVSVNDTIVRISTRERDIDATDHDGDLMMKTAILVVSDKKEPVNILEKKFNEFMSRYTEERIKEQAVKLMKKRRLKTFHLSKRTREYYSPTS